MTTAVNPRGTGPLRWVRRVLVGVGVVALAWAGYERAAPALYRLANREALSELARPSVHPVEPEGTPETMPALGTLIATFEIPRLGFSELIAEGDDMKTLKAAIGHLPDTPMPWRPGNSAFAGHRDVQFRPLRAIKVGDAIVIQTGHGALNYRVRDTLVVYPNDVWVLAPTNGRMVTLITCYPFVFVGHAPQRFIVRADAVEVPSLLAPPDA